jgi:SAM-dependent methyltransferase
VTPPETLTAEGTRIQGCPVCGCPALLRAHAVVAPFLAELTGTNLKTRAGYRECGNCGLTFFDYRYSEQQMERLYGGYRDSRYFEARQSWEPWYRQRVNEAFTPGTAAVEDRVRFATEALRSAGVGGPIRCALDVGGDQGQFFPRLTINRRIVLELSHRELLPGVERVSSFDHLSEQPDLVVLAHVLEHLSDPAKLMRQIRQTLVPGGTLYVEVPQDRPRVRRWHAQPGFAIWNGLISGRRWAFIPADLASGVTKQRGWRIPRLGVLKESEHINFFDSVSLRFLLESCGFCIRGSASDENARAGGLRLGRLGMVASTISSAQSGSAA